MRYTLEYKLKCIEMYRQGIWPETPDGIKNPQDFHKMIRRWKRIEEHQGLLALSHKHHRKQWTPEERFELVSKVLAGFSIQETACNAGIDSGQLYQWVKKYKANGYDGLINIPMGRPRKNPIMKKTSKNTKPLTEEEREELIRLRSEIEYLKTENEVIKKSIALRHAEWDRQLKAKKQKSSKNSVKKDSE